MSKLYQIMAAVGVQVLYALTIGGTIIAIHRGELIIALLCAAATSCLRPMWAELRFLWKYGDDEIIAEEREEAE